MLFNGKLVEGDAFDDTNCAHVVADEYGMELHVASFSENDFVDLIVNAIYHLDSPVVGCGALLGKQSYYRCDLWALLNLELWHQQFTD